MIQSSKKVFSVALTLFLISCGDDVSQVSDVVQESNSKFLVTMDYVSGDSHGTLNVMMAPRLKLAPPNAIEACIGTKFSCTHGTSKKFKLVSSSKSIDGNRGFDFPNKISLLQPVEIQVQATFATNLISETVQLTDKWVYKPAPVKNFSLTDNSAASTIELLMAILKSLINSNTNVPVLTSQPTQVNQPVQPVQQIQQIQQTQAMPQQNAGQAQTSLDTSRFFNQGNTNWCWGYSAFHTLRQYYANAPESDVEVTKWKLALAQLNSDEGLRKFMGKYVSEGQLGEPNMFMENMQKEYGLSPGRWRDAYASGMDTAKSNLEKGIPSAYCNHGHCMSLIGIAGSTITVADSSGGYTFQDSYQNLQNELTQIMTLQ